MMAGLGWAVLLAALLAGSAHAQAPPDEMRGVRLPPGPPGPAGPPDASGERFWLTFYPSVQAGLFASADEPRRLRRRQPRVSAAEVAVAQLRALCSQQAQELEQWPVERVLEAVNASEPQRQSFGRMRELAARTAAKLRTDCETPTAPSDMQRFDAMLSRLRAMLAAVEAVLPALREAYGSLDPAQRARFDAIGSGSQRSPRDATTQAQATGFCHAMLSEQPVHDSIRRLARATRPAPDQFAAVDKVMAASAQANQALQQSCALDRSGSPIDQLATMQRRLQAAADATAAVRGALIGYYEQLEEPQRDRFARLGYGGGLGPPHLPPHVREFQAVMPPR